MTIEEQIKLIEAFTKILALPELADTIRDCTESLLQKIIIELNFKL